MARKKIGKYLAYALGEILLVVIGILIALQINNWNNLRIEHQKELKTYRNIKQQVLKDRSELVEMQAFNQINMGQLEKANALISAQNREAADTLAYLIMMMSYYSDFYGTGNIYETLVNSGDIKYLENTYNFINRMEDIHWSIIIEELSPELRGVLNYNSFEQLKPDRIRKPDKLYSPEVQNIIYEVKYLSIGKDTIYGRAIREIDSITHLIDGELGLGPISIP